MVVRKDVMPILPRPVDITSPLIDLQLSHAELSSQENKDLFRNTWLDREAPEMLKEGHRIALTAARGLNRGHFFANAGAYANLYGLIDGVTCNQLFSTFSNWFAGPAQTLKMSKFASFQYVFNYMIPMALQFTLARKLNVDMGVVHQILELCDEIKALEEERQDLTEAETTLRLMLRQIKETSQAA
ncbi:unnamed protein product [Bursaphelenchus xylophilus]|uniref:(pine wood nematode) hypothetical protein n=1 Tax=Bursaphelenchus xylophilus TaxID=6326 RepID=A0A1I7RZ77_BURXY|nr:unnamed protein product [Bursaphelenchus xylophilus]CAG9106769.1 unnamed protein product [Bursaphelenchus xylophilus]